MLYLLHRQSIRLILRFPYYTQSKVFYLKDIHHHSGLQSTYILCL